MGVGDAKKVASHPTKEHFTTEHSPLKDGVQRLLSNLPKFAGERYLLYIYTFTTDHYCGYLTPIAEFVGMCVSRAHTYVYLLYIYTFTTDHYC